MQRRKQWMAWAGGGAVVMMAAAMMAAVPAVPGAPEVGAGERMEAPAPAASPSDDGVAGVDERLTGAVEAPGAVEAAGAGAAARAREAAGAAAAGLVLETQVGSASYYANVLAGRRTASGVPYDPSAAVAAHRRLPFGTRLRVHNLANGRTVEVEVVDRGPFAKGRILDLSRSAAEALDFIRAGHTRVRIEVLEYGG